MSSKGNSSIVPLSYLPRGCEYSEGLLPVKMFFFSLVFGLACHHGQKLWELNVATAILVEFVNDGLQQEN